MSKKIKNIYIGVAWPYVNDVFHIGNLAGAYLPPDIFSRFHKLKGNRVLMVSGSDFHGTPITIRADKEKKKPRDIALRYHKLNKTYLKKFYIDYTIYTSTHTANHRKIVQDVFIRLLKNGFIKVLKTEQLYSEKSKKFLQDRYIEGECPYCHSKGARGDQCEKCGRTLDALDLVNPISKLDGSPLVKKTTENYFLDLPKLQEDIKKWILSRKDMRNWVKKEALGWIKEGLKPRAITRDMSYGVPLPSSRIPKSYKIDNMKNKVFYVWFEAVIGYLSAAIEYSQKIGVSTYWRKFFYDPKAETYYFVGQDNLVFHLINWPGQLIAYDKKINLPTNVFVNKFLLLEGEKMSKSRNWFIDTSYLVSHYPIDAIRFYLALNMPERKKFNFTWKGLIEVNNSVLVSVVGNFIHRLLIFGRNNFGRKFDLSTHNVSKEIASRLKKVFVKTSIYLEKGDFQFSLQEIVSLASFGNKYIDKHQIWKLVKEKPEKAKSIVLDSLCIIEALKILLYPFIPASAEKINKILGHKKRIVVAEGENKWVFPSDLGIIVLSSKIEPIFPKIDKENIEVETKKLKS